ncbi:spoIIIJ-associated protein [Mycobacterium tuberculosis BTB11-133]|nr:spoIIIJ-associated protein [Mycobacterium tuberculosis BTB11-133]
MADADTTDFDVDAEAPGGGVREDTATDADEADDQEERLVAEGEIAGDYLEELLDVLDFDGDIDLDVEGNRAVVSIDGSDDLNKLVGRGGEVLDALQELTRTAERANARHQRRAGSRRSTGAPACDDRIGRG